MDNRISFGSTYRIPLVQQGVNKAKRQALKQAVSQYQNFLYPSGENGYVRVSVRKRLDNRVEAAIKRNGFKVYQKFERNNVSKANFEDSNVSKMDLYIASELKKRNYQQFGKNKPKMSDSQRNEVNELSELELELREYIEKHSDFKY